MLCCEKVCEHTKTRHLVSLEECNTLHSFWNRLLRLLRLLLLSSPRFNFAFLRHRVEVIPQMCSPEAGVLLPSLLWLAAVWTLAVVPTADSVRPPRYRTLYACEGSSLQITCEEGTHINLIRANFGRFSISVCNDNGNVDWSVDCMSHRSFRVMQERYF